MDSLIIRGGNRLEGVLTASGAKMLLADTRSHPADLRSLFPAVGSCVARHHHHADIASSLGAKTARRKMERC